MRDGPDAVRSPHQDSYDELLNWWNRQYPVLNEGYSLIVEEYGGMWTFLVQRLDGQIVRMPTNLNGTLEQVIAQMIIVARQDTNGRDNQPA